MSGARIPVKYDTWCCQFNATPLHYACEKGDAEIARLLLRAGADPHALDIVSPPSPSSITTTAPACADINTWHAAQLSSHRSVAARSSQEALVLLAEERVGIRVGGSLLGCATQPVNQRRRPMMVQFT